MKNNMKTNFDIDDYSSYSSVVNTLQGDASLGKEAIIQISDLYFAKLKEQAEYESMAGIAKMDSIHLRHCIESILNHLKIALPISVINGERIIQLDKDSISENKNVL